MMIRGSRSIIFIFSFLGIPAYRDKLYIYIYVYIYVYIYMYLYTYI